MSKHIRVPKLNQMRRLNSWSYWALKTRVLYYHITFSGEMKPPFIYLDIVEENGGRSHTEVIVCMYGQHTQESMDGPGTVAIPAHRWITRENDVFLVPVRACENGFAGWVRPSRPASATLSLNLVLSTKASTYIPPTAKGLVPNLSGRGIACRWRSLPRVRWHNACNIPLSTMRYVKRKNTKTRFKLSKTVFPTELVNCSEKWLGARVV